MDPIAVAILSMNNTPHDTDLSLYLCPPRGLLNFYRYLEGLDRALTFLSGSYRIPKLWYVNSSS